MNIKLCSTEWNIEHIQHFNSLAYTSAVFGGILVALLQAEKRKSSAAEPWYIWHKTATLIWILNEWKEQGSQVIAYRSLCFPFQSTVSVCVFVQ